jgi:hypothetical protein
LSRIDWGTIPLFGGGLALARLMFETRLAEALGRAVVRISGLVPLRDIDSLGDSPGRGPAASSSGSACAFSARC